MPRTPTGNPRGRPVGSGTLGPQTRLTVRIPTDLFDRLEAYAEGRAYTRGAPQLAKCVREAIEHYLVCPDKRQTINVPETAGAPDDDPSTCSTQVPALAVAMPQASETPSSATPAPLPERREPAVKATLALPEDIVKIAEARAQYDRLSERAFIQLLYDRGIYRHRAKDGHEVPLPHSTYRDWIQQAREAGLL